MYTLFSITISLSHIDEPAPSNLPAGVHSMSEIVPLVLAARGITLQDDPGTEPTLIESQTGDFFDVLVTELESALAS